MSTIHQYEYEERYLLNEEQFLRVEKSLRAQAIHITPDNKKSYFFVLPNINISIATSPSKTVLKYKGGQIGKGNGFKEYEIGLQPESLDDALEFFENLLNLKPQYSEQFRVNFALENGIEAALKYTQTWGFHLELEKVYVTKEENKAKSEEEAKHLIDKLATSLDIIPLTKEDLKGLADGHERGEYTPSAFLERFTTLLS